MDVLLTLLGAAVVVLGLRDMYHTLFDPNGKGSISHAVMAAMWSVSKRVGHRFGSGIGPATMVTVVVVWVALQALGWALIYVPHIPGGFAYSSGINPARYNDFAEAFYVSLVTLATLGFGDVVPTDPWMRMAAPLEAVVGFALLTTALTWFSQVYPPLSRRRALALKLKGLADTGYAEKLPRLDPVAAGRVLETLAAEFRKARIDFTQHNESYYFQEVDPDLALARQLPYTLTLRDTAAASTVPDLQIGAALLSKALEQFGSKLDNEFLRVGGNLDDVFAAYAQDHGRTHRN